MIKHTHTFSNLIDVNTGKTVELEMFYETQEQLQEHLTRLDSIGARASAFGARCRAMLDKE
jgi:uncharacterized protein YfcZ (UPF0381/DUF406 family)